MSLLKRTYVAGARIARRGAEGVGLLSGLERTGRSNLTARWARSLFAIYDIDDMVRLDLPWWTFRAVDQIDAFLKSRPNARVFEYGSGASTIWLAKRSASVTSVEHEADWLAVVRHKAAAYPHARLIFKPADATLHPDERFASAKPGWSGRTFYEYVHAIDEVEGEFDLIVIDGRARPACLTHAAPRLARDGMIVFDNSARPPYRAAIAASGFQATRTGGLTACLPYPDETTLLSNARA